MIEKELLATFGPELMQGKKAIIRNIKKCRELYNHYASNSNDSKFYLMHFDKLFYDFKLTNQLPLVELYADEENRSPLRHLLFREYALYLVHAAAKLWTPELDLDRTSFHTCNSIM